MTVCIPTLTYKEYLRIWNNREPSFYGLKATLITNELEYVDDLDDLDIFEVIDKQLFFLSVLKYELTYQIILE